MKGLLLETGNFALIVLVLFGAIYFLIKKKREHEDFWLATITLSLVLVGAIYITMLSLQDVFAYKNKDIAMEKGMCDVSFFNSSGKFYSEEQIIFVDINGLILEGSTYNFEDVNEGVYSCEVKYIKKSKTLLELVDK